VADAPYDILAEIGLPVTPADVQQGIRLVDAAKDLNLVPLNKPFSRLVMAPKSGKRVVRLSDGLTLTVVLPDAESVLKLRDEWVKALKKSAKKTRGTRGSGVETAAASIDISPANLSSIVVVAECQGRRMLLTGDARGDKIVEALRKAKLLKSGTCHFDVLKLPHHGSDKNVTEDFFKTVQADHYVVSGDGSYGNPEIATLQMLSNARPDDGFTLHLTYKTGKEKLAPKLRSFFDKERQNGRTYAVNYPSEGARSIKIDLLDKLTY